MKMSTYKRAHQSNKIFNRAINKKSILKLNSITQKQKGNHKQRETAQ